MAKFELDLFEIRKGRFSHDEAHMSKIMQLYAFVFCMCKNAIQFVLDISFISSFFYINIYLSIRSYNKD